MTTAYPRPSSEHWTAQIYLPAGFFFIISSTEPVVQVGDDGRITGVLWDRIEEYGDKIAYIDWTTVTGVNPKYVPARAAEPVAERAPSAPRKRGKKGKKDKAEPAPRIIPSRVLAEFEGAFEVEVEAGNYLPTSHDRFIAARTGAWLKAHPSN